MVSASPGVQGPVSDWFLFGMVYILRVEKTYGRIARKSDTPRGAGGLVSGAASKAVVPLVEASR